MPLLPTSDLRPEGSDGPASVWGEVLPVQRALVDLVDCPLEASPDSLLTEGVVLFTDDGRGIARSMADQLADLGQRTVFLGPSEDPASGPDPGAFHADLTDPEAVADMLRRVREEHGPISGLIHLAPLAEAVEGEAWDRRAWRDVKSLYLLARALGDDLRQSGRDGKAFLLAATALGGGFGFEADDTAAAMPGHGGVLGFVKCLAHEWPEVLVRGVDLDASESPRRAGRVAAPGAVLSRGTGGGRIPRLADASPGNPGPPPCPRPRRRRPLRAGRAGPGHGRGPGHHRGDRPGAGPPLPADPV